MDRIAHSAFLAFVLVLATATAGVTPATASTPETVTLDEDNPLASDTAAAEYDENGVAGGAVDAYDMRVTAAKSHEDVGLDGMGYSAATDATNHYLRVQYNESIERTIRFYVDGDVWHPHNREIAAQNADVEATFESVGEDNYTAVEITFTGPTDAVFQVPRVVSGYYHARDEGRGWLENNTGYEVPTIFGGGQQWERVTPSDLSGNNTTVALQTNESEPMIQYDTDNGSGEQWVSAPPCDTTRGEDAPVCTFERPDDASHVYVLAEGEDPPPVRYKYGGGLLDQAKEGLSELMEAPSRALDDLRGLFGGDS